VVLKVNGVVWHNSGDIYTVHYQDFIQMQVGCGETFDIEVRVTNINSQVVICTDSITTPVPEI